MTERADDSFRPVRRAISIAIRSPEEPGLVLSVLRPPDDADLPDTWGLPAGSLRPAEDWYDAVLRAGREKLGVELRVGRELNHGTHDRAEYTLEMKLFEAEIVSGEPSVPQPHPGVTQYRGWRWGEPGALRQAAKRGSLCSRLMLEVS